MELRRKSTREEWHAFFGGFASGVVVTLIIVLITLATLKGVVWNHV
jgi:hypothetical protein